MLKYPDELAFVSPHDGRSTLQIMKKRIFIIAAQVDFMKKIV
jgi:hypothetical protein